jgi:hypothetical protein
MRLPVNILLYVFAAALLAFAGYTFVKSLEDVDKAKRQKLADDAKAKAQDLLSRGKGEGPSTAGWNYQTELWRNRFLAPNLVGKDLRKAEESQAAAAAEAAKPAVVEVRPLSDLIELVSLMCDTATDGKGGQSHVIVRYKDAASVQAPSWYLLENQVPAAGNPSGAGPSDGVGRAGGRPGGARPGGARPGAATPPPASSAGQEFVQRVWVTGDGTPRNEATLWPPFQDVRLVRVATDARSAYFVRGNVGKPVEGQDPATVSAPVEEELFKTSFDISDDLMKFLVDQMRSGDKKVTESRAAAANPNSGWRDVEETTLVGNKVIVSRKDQQMMQQAPETFLDRVNVDAYVSRTGSGLRGLRVLNVAPEISTRYGIQSNDLILSVNGEPVSTKADAIAVGKRQYGRGVRTFIVRMISDGREIERVIEAPDR